MTCIKCHKKVTVETSVSYLYHNIHCNNCYFDMVEEYKKKHPKNPCPSMAVLKEIQSVGLQIYTEKYKLK